MTRLFAILTIAAVMASQMADAQSIGNNKQNQLLNLPMEECTGSESCTKVNTYVTLDANWRWLHKCGDYQNCYTGNQWDSALCPDSPTCTKNCCIEGVDNTDWSGTYGVTTSGSDLTLKFVTVGPYSTNIGSRTYLMDSSKSKYYMFKLLNKEFTFDVDVSDLPCGLNGALYFVEMEADGGSSSHPTNEGGAAFGTGYCDAQCPHDIKYINGETNNEDWRPSDNDANAGYGHYGTCCMEMDIWEANSMSTAYTAHPCDTVGLVRCEGVECGDNISGDRYKGICDKDGCDFNSWRMGDRSFYGPGGEFTVDSSKPMTVVTQFITSDGTENGDLVEIRRLYVQDGKVIDNSLTDVDGVDQSDSITTNMCTQSKSMFGDIDDFTKKGGLKRMGESLARGVVLVMSLWDDHEANMLWLDSDYPLDADANTPGVSRGPCPRDSGDPADMESNHPDSSVKFSKIRVGSIGSTFPGGQQYKN